MSCAPVWYGPRQADFLKARSSTLLPVSSNSLHLAKYECTVRQLGNSLGNIRHWQPLLSRYLRDAAAVDSETKGLEEFYANVRDRIQLAKNDKSRQDIIRNLYDTFFQNAFPKMSERLGIVYTPVEVVDFILRSAQEALGKHFGESFSGEGVQVLDPFSGTGTFPVRLIQSGLIEPEKLPGKYAGEIHANEIVLLAYYIASINIETAYHAATGEYRPFAGMVLTDTFQMTEEGDLVDKMVLPENNAKAERQLAQEIRVIVGKEEIARAKKIIDNARWHERNGSADLAEAEIKRLFRLRGEEKSG